MRNLAAACAGLTLTTVPIAQDGGPSLCAPYARFVSHLEAKFHEQRYAFGVTPDGKLVEFYTSPSGTWTVLETRPDGTACVVTHGGGWERLETPQVLSQPS
jgi:hypothetical protein